MDEIESLLLEDIRDKKKAGYGVYHRAPRRGIRGGRMLTPADLLTGKAKRDYIKSGEVVTYYMDEKDIAFVKSIEEIRQMPKEDGKAYIQRMKNSHTLSELMKAWDLKNHYYVYKIYDEFEIPRDAALFKRTPKLTTAQQNNREIVGEVTHIVPSAASAAVTAKTKETPTSRKMLLVLEGEFSGKEGSESIAEYAGLMKENKNYIVTLHIEEKK